MEAPFFSSPTPYGTMRLALRSSASSALDLQPVTRGSNTMSIVRKTSADIPPMTEKRAAELRALAERPDSEIDLSDAPELDAEGWKHAMQGRFFRPTKTQVTIRIDSDVLHWLKSQGEGYQTRLNALLREAMTHELHRQASARKEKLANVEG